MPSAQARRAWIARTPEETRTAILQAAVREFAREGIAGARTDAIARAAKVNKALLLLLLPRQGRTVWSGPRSGLSGNGMNS